MELRKARRFQLGVNHLFVFQKTGIPAAVPCPPAAASSVL
jgi:hypothetical protein